MLQTTPYEPLLEQISTYFRIADDDDELTLNSLTIQANHEDAVPTLEVLSQNFTAYQTQLRSTIPVDKLLEVYESANQCLQDWEWMDTEADQKVSTALSSPARASAFFRHSPMKPSILSPSYARPSLNTTVKQLNCF